VEPRDDVLLSSRILGRNTDHRDAGGGIIYRMITRSGDWERDPETLCPDPRQIGRACPCPAYLAAGAKRSGSPTDTESAVTAAKDVVHICVQGL